MSKTSRDVIRVDAVLHLCLQAKEFPRLMLTSVHGCRAGNEALHTCRIISHACYTKHSVFSTRPSAADCPYVCDEVHVQAQLSPEVHCRGRHFSGSGTEQVPGDRKGDLKWLCFKSKTSKMLCLSGLHTFTPQLRVPCTRMPSLIHCGRVQQHEHTYTRRFVRRRGLRSV